MGPRMIFDPLFCPECGEMARGTVETVSGVAEFDAEDDGSVTYSGYTAIWWEEQQTIEDAGGNVRLVCHNGHDWSARERREPDAIEALPPETGDVDGGPGTRPDVPAHPLRP